jgi:hypothetical protein
MNVLSRDQQAAVISALTEGCSIRATERLTGIHRDTIMRLGVRVGVGCAELHDQLMRFVQVNRLELEELWSYVGKKQRRITPTDPADLGDQYVFIGIDANLKFNDPEIGGVLAGYMGCPEGKDIPQRHVGSL